MRYRYELIILPFLVAACGAPVASRQTVAPVPTNALASAPTVVLATSTPAATVTSPSQAATPTGETIVAPTSVPAPTSASQSTSVPAPTGVLAPTSAPESTSAPAPTSAPAIGVNEVLFLRDGRLTAHGVDTGVERTIADNISDFVATPDGALLALVRGVGREAEIWTVRRDGSELTRRTEDTRADATPALAADSSALLFASADTAAPYTRQWLEWGQWCATSEVRLIELATGEARTLGAGCDPAFAPDNKRIAFATPPTSDAPGFPHSAANTIRLVNRLGQNGWTFASADGTAERGMVVYAPAWSPDGAQVSFQRFVGYQALVDIGMGELAPAFKGGGQPFYSGAGWQLPAHFSPTATRVAVVENNAGDARGFGGYDSWSVSVVQMEGQRSDVLPSGDIQLIGGNVEKLVRAQGGAWSPDGATVAVILPPKWSPELSLNEPVNNGEETPGDLWLWQPGQQPRQQIAENVDFASPVVWLP